MISRQDSMIGCILGTAVGDAIGLPTEGLSKRRLTRMFRNLDGHRFLFGRGMTSDDTEHTCMVAQSLIESAGDAPEFSRSLSRRLRLWLLCLPAGTGMATAKAILRLWIGFKPDRSGVFSAGNGPAMRCAVIGVAYGDDLPKMRELVRASTRITHTDPKAEYGALAVALAAHTSTSEETVDPQKYLDTLRNLLGDEAREFIALAEKAVESAGAGESAEMFAESLGLGNGVSGYTYHTVPVVLQAWLTHQNDYRPAILSIVNCGGDTDTTAAILGAIIGASVGKSGIPVEWLDGIVEWPRTVQWMERLGKNLVLGQPKSVLPILSVSASRNLVFLIVVLLHGFRRLLPPY